MTMPSTARFSQECHRSNSHYEQNSNSHNGDCCPRSNHLALLIPGEETLTEVVLLAAAPNSFREMKNYTKELIFSPRFIIFFRFLASEISCQQ